MEKSIRGRKSASKSSFEGLIKVAIKARIKSFNIRDGFPLILCHLTGPLFSAVTLKVSKNKLLLTHIRTSLDHFCLEGNQIDRISKQSTCYSRPFIQLKAFQFLINKNCPFNPFHCVFWVMTNNQTTLFEAKNAPFNPSMHSKT